MARRASLIQPILARLGVVASDDEVREALNAATAALILLADDGKDVGDGRVDLFLAYLSVELHTALPAEALGLIETVICEMPPELTPLRAPHALETLQELKQRGFATGLICNAGFTTAPWLRRKLDGYGLGPHLDVLVFSDEVRLAKPHPLLFSQATDALRVPAAASVFVGDSPHNDIFGAQRAGMRAVQIGARQREGVEPDARIQALSELLPALRELGYVDDTLAVPAPIEGVSTRPPAAALD